MASTPQQEAPPNEAAEALKQLIDPQTQPPTAKNDKPNFTQRASKQTEKCMALSKVPDNVAEGLGGHSIAQQHITSCLAEKGSPQTPTESTDNPCPHLLFNDSMIPSGQFRDTAPVRDAGDGEPQRHRAIVTGEDNRHSKSDGLTDEQHLTPALPSGRQRSMKPKDQQVPVDAPISLTYQPTPAYPKDGSSHNAEITWSGPPAAFERRLRTISGMIQPQPDLTGAEQVIEGKPASAKMLKRKILGHPRSEEEGMGKRPRMLIQPRSPLMLTFVPKAMGNKPTPQIPTEKLSSKTQAALVEGVGVTQTRTAELCGAPSNPGEPDKLNLA